MKRLLYLYPEEWSGRRAREVHTLSTCAALARDGVEVTLVVAGGELALRRHLREVAPDNEPAGVKITALSRTLGPIRSAAIFSIHFRRWLRAQAPFDAAYVIHLKAAAMLRRASVPHGYEAHEIFAETPQPSSARQARLETLERNTLAGARWRVATSTALATALDARYGNGPAWAIVPNAGQPPLEHSVGDPTGPFVYCGSIAEWKGLDRVVAAARTARVALRVVGGTESEWRRLGERGDVHGIAWHPRVPLGEIPRALAGARAGLIPTEPESGSGRYSCPMKLFDYARCGLPVLTTALPALASLETGSWCRQVSAPGTAAWTTALAGFQYDASEADAARAWTRAHTWTERARQLRAALGL